MKIAIASGWVTLGELKRIVGGLSRPGKMPCYGTSIPAERCNVGGKLRSVSGSVCFKCYALKGRYVFPNVKAALERRYQALSHPDWVESMSILINHYEDKPDRGYFRWHDAGDLQSAEHLQQIIDVVRATPNVKHWLPTREYALVLKWKQAYGEFPDNITVRVSATKVDGKVPKILGMAVSSVAKDKKYESWTCPAPTQGGKCGPCRACWNPTVKHVTYKIH
jgi:hypothetical protein